MPNLKQQFTQAMFDIYRRAKTEAGYNATIFLQHLAAILLAPAGRSGTGNPTKPAPKSGMLACSYLQISQRCVALGKPCPRPTLHLALSAHFRVALGLIDLSPQTSQDGSETA
jgi:hypothetical protein